MMSIWQPDIPVWEIVLRSLAVFTFLLLAIRFSGKRDVGEMSPSDLILLLLLSANVHTSLSGKDHSLTGGLIGAAVLMLANFLLNSYAYRNRKFEKALKGEPELIIHAGNPQRQVMKRHHLTETMLKVAIRKEGVEHFEQVKMAVLEPDGTISVIKKSTA
jgi:uncharacterized membrane protein YcaP (DUF421 family)